MFGYQAPHYSLWMAVHRGFLEQGVHTNWLGKHLPPLLRLTYQNYLVEEADGVLEQTAALWATVVAAVPCADLAAVMEVSVCAIVCVCLCVCSYVCLRPRLCVCMSSFVSVVIRIDLFVCSFSCVWAYTCDYECVLSVGICLYMWKSVAGHVFVSVRVASTTHIPLVISLHRVDSERTRLCASNACVWLCACVNVS